MAHNAAGYEFTLRASRAVFWFSCILCATGVVVGFALAGLSWTESPFALHTMPMWFATSGREAIVAIGLLIMLLSVVTLHRTLVTAHECRIGAAGILTRTLLSSEQFIPWVRFRGASLARRRLKLAYDNADGITDETWVEIPWGEGATALRVKTYLAEKERALASQRASQVTVEAVA